MFLLDTNVVSELRKLRPHGALLAWYDAQDEYAIFVPSIALCEMQVGIEVTRQRDVAKAKEIEEWVDRIAATSVVLDLDAQSARLAARLLHGKPPELLEDAMIAAIAATNRLSRRDKKHEGLQTTWRDRDQPLRGYALTETTRPRRFAGARCQSRTPLTASARC